MIYKLFVSSFLACAGFIAGSAAQTPQQVRRAFQDIRSDNIPGNGCLADGWLYDHREKLKEQMLTELYKTDRQGRDAIFLVLFDTKSFVPDLRFARFLLIRMSEEDTYVQRGDMHVGPDENSKGGLGVGAHHWAWYFIEDHFIVFEPLLVEQICTTKDMWFLWSIAWIMKKHQSLEKHVSSFAPGVLTRATANLRDDNIDLNASMAARLLLLLGDKSLPCLRAVANTGDAQQNNIARALVDVITTRHVKAFGYLKSKLSLERSPFIFEDKIKFDTGEPEGDSRKWEDFYSSRDSYP